MVFSFFLPSFAAIMMIFRARGVMGDPLRDIGKTAPLGHNSIYNAWSGRYIRHYALGYWCPVEMASFRAIVGTDMTDIRIYEGLCGSGMPATIGVIKYIILFADDPLIIFLFIFFFLKEIFIII